LAGYQAIVVPDFLAEASETYLIEYVSQAEANAEPGELVVRAVRGSVTRPVTIAYRVAQATADRYGLDGDAPLRDRAGRDIRVFEGLVLQLPAKRVAALGITAADMDAVTARIAPAFRRLWAAADTIEADRSAEVSLGSGLPGSPVLSSYLADPGARSQLRNRLVAAVAAVLLVAGLSFAVWSMTASPAPQPKPSPSPIASAKAHPHKANHPAVRKLHGVAGTLAPSGGVRVPSTPLAPTSDGTQRPAPRCYWSVRAFALVFARSMLPRISSASLVQVNGVGCLFQVSMKLPMAVVSSLTERNEPRRMAWRVMTEKKQRWGPYTGK
jgi:hypothetical protein